MMASTGCSAHFITLVGSLDTSLPFDVSIWQRTYIHTYILLSPRVFHTEVQHK